MHGGHRVLASKEFTWKKVCSPTVSPQSDLMQKAATGRAEMLLFMQRRPWTVTHRRIFCALHPDWLKPSGMKGERVWFEQNIFSPKEEADPGQKGPLDPVERETKATKNEVLSKWNGKTYGQWSVCKCALAFCKGVLSHSQDPKVGRESTLRYQHTGCKPWFSWVCDNAYAQWAFTYSEEQINTHIKWMYIW